MSDVKNNKLMVVLVLIGVASIIYMLVGRQTTLQDKMQNALESHDHENALVFASRLLEKEPGNQNAINIIKKSGQILLYLQLAQAKIPDYRVITDQQTGQKFFYLHNAQIETSDFGGTSNNVMVKAEKVYEDFNTIRAYTAKAKDLDSKFETTLDFEKKLESAQMFVLNIVARNVFDAGKSVYSTVYTEYQKKSEIINTASNSEYLNIFLKVQSAWAPMEMPIEEIKHNIEPVLDKMDDTGQLLAKVKAGKLTDSLLSYIQVLRKSVDTLLAPKGSFKDFSLLSRESTDAYKKAQSRLAKALPGPTKGNNFSVLVKSVVDYKLFHLDSTVDLINKNQYLQGV